MFGLALAVGAEGAVEESVLVAGAEGCIEAACCHFLIIIIDIINVMTTSMAICRSATTIQIEYYIQRLIYSQ